MTNEQWLATDKARVKAFIERESSPAAQAERAAFIESITHDWKPAESFKRAVWIDPDGVERCSSCTRAMQAVPSTLQSQLYAVAKHAERWLNYHNGAGYQSFSVNESVFLARELKRVLDLIEGHDDAS